MRVRSRRTQPSPCAKQTFSVTDPIPPNMTYQSGGNYNSVTKSIEWTGSLEAGNSRTIAFTAKVNVGTAAGTTIENKAKLFDDASGSDASVSVTVN